MSRIDGNPPPISEIREFGKVTYRYLNHEKNADCVLRLHLMLYDGNGPGGEAGVFGVCIELALFSWGATLEEAKTEILDIVPSHIKDIFDNGNGEEQILEEMGSTDMEDYWALYRKINSRIGLEGINIEEEIHKPYLKKIKELTEKIDVLQTRHIEIMESIPELRQVTPSFSA